MLISVFSIFVLVDVLSCSMTLCLQKSIDISTSDKCFFLKSYILHMLTSLQFLHFMSISPIYKFYIIYNSMSYTSMPILFLMKPFKTILSSSLGTNLSTLLSSGKNCILSSLDLAIKRLKDSFIKKLP